MKLTTRVRVAAGIAVGIAAPAMAQLLYDNGAIITTPAGACIPVGLNSSLTQTALGLTVNGFTNSLASGLTLADDFTIPATDPGWAITSFSFYAYMSGNAQTTTSPMLSV